MPSVFGAGEVTIHPVDLPVAAWYPALSPQVLAGLQHDATSAIAKAEAELNNKREFIATLHQKLEKIVAAEAVAQSATTKKFAAILTERFERLRPDIWKVASGKWDHEPGKLGQNAPGSFVTIVAEVTPPRDFMARVKYRTLEAGSIHSVGFSFDMVELKDAQAVYSATDNKTSSIQAFHRVGGVETYPQPGIVPWPIKIGQELTVDVAAREQQLNVWVNGELAIAYTMPARVRVESSVSGHTRAPRNF